ncbi:hypothetical protein PG985_007616 [Apiospora marii]|uniref:uncharacterized protein n=1 Tax=Apiospora marii TaxID=335849 RepID=UPI0031312EEC
MPTGQTMITGANLRKYFWLRMSAVYYSSFDEKAAISVAFGHILGTLHRVVGSLAGQQYQPQVPGFDEVVLSLILLGDTLSHVFSEIGVSAAYEKRYRWPYPQYGKSMLLGAGWCPGEVAALMNNCRPTVLFYLSTLDRRREEKDHSRCSVAEGCFANQLDEKTYKQVHSADCSGERCAMVEVSLTKTSDVLENGGIPLVRVTETGDDMGVSLQTDSFQIQDAAQRPSYVAISHVWSDGLGNQIKNAMWTCQLRRIQRSVDEVMNRDSESKASWPWWIDTLCVPREVNIRMRAIARMAKTYAHATKVLILDRWLCNSSPEAEPLEILTRISHCDWNTRLWTLNEIMLAQEPHFQLRNTTGPLDRWSKQNLMDNTTEVAEVIATMAITDLVESPAPLILLYALKDIAQDIESIPDLVAVGEEYDSSADDLLLLGVNQLAEYATKRERELGRAEQALAPLQLEPADLGPCPFREPRAVCNAIRNTSLDPVFSYAFKTATRTRGTWYGDTPFPGRRTWPPARSGSSSGSGPSTPLCCLPRWGPGSAAA